MEKPTLHPALTTAGQAFLVSACGVWLNSGRAPPSLRHAKARTILILIDAGLSPCLSRGTEAHAIIMRFQTMIRTRADDDLDPWIRDAEKSLIASFARGIMKDKAAVRAAINEPWSNGQTEGQVNRLKLIKRQMYGRAKVDLIEARLRGAT